MRRLPRHVAPTLLRPLSTATPSPPHSTSSSPSFQTVHDSEPRTSAQHEKIPLDQSSVFRSRSTHQLVQAWFVLSSCSINALVRNAPFLLDCCTRVLGRAVVDVLLKSTFFGHFCAGEDAVSIQPTVTGLQNAGIGSILDFAAEADDIEERSSHGDGSIRSLGSDVARHYLFSGEDACDAHVEVFENCIDAVAGTAAKTNSTNGFAAIKLTALGPPKLLKRMSAAIIETQNLFNTFDTDNSGDLTHAEFAESWQKFFLDGSGSNGSISRSEIGCDTTSLGQNLLSLDEMLQVLDPNGTGSIDYVEWTSSLFRLENLPLLTARCKSKGPLSAAVLTDAELEAVRAMERRIDRLASRAAEKGVRLMVDAEQTYFQPAIDNSIYGLQERYNSGLDPNSGKHRFTIFGTHQCYLKDAGARLRRDLKRAHKKGYNFATKLVRGAYMVSERQRALELGYNDPIHDTLRDTHDSYHSAVDLLLHEIADNQNSALASTTPVEFMVASHNQESVQHVLEEMQRLGLPVDAGVYFGQLLGMSDHITYALGAEGYKAYKYVPYGPVHEVIPYLLRRAQENSSLLGSKSSKTEIAVLREEIKRRIMAPMAP